jgi:hypothetical protein
VHAQALCINESVLALGAAARINECCLDLQSGAGASQRKKAAAAAAASAGGKAQAAKAPGGGCPFRKANRTSLRDLKACFCSPSSCPCCPHIIPLHDSP